MDLKMEVYTPALELAGLLEVHRSIIWEEKAFSSGSFSVESLITDQSRALLVPENIIWIAGETAGVIEYVQQQAGQDGPYITVKGSGLTGLLSRRILWGLYDLSGKAPDIMYRLVDDCCINPTRGDTEARKIPNLVLAEHGAFDLLPTIRAQKTGGTLLEALEQLGEAYSIAFGVRFNPQVPRMEFWARPGVNRSVRQTVNEPVFYSTELDDVLSSEYAYNAQDYRNVALVAGEGEGGSRTMVVVTGGGDTGPAPGPDPDPGPEPPEPTLYTITLSVDPEGYGAVTGAGSYQEGASATLTATAGDGYKFTAWQENGETVSESESYTFTVSGDRALVAVFEAVSRLPAGYTEVEYITTAYRNCFETGFSVNSKTDRIEITVAPRIAQTAGYTSFAFNTDNIGSYCLYLKFAYSSSTSVAITAIANSTTYSSITSTMTILNNKKRTCIFDFPNKSIDLGENITKPTSGINNSTLRNFGNLVLGYSTSVTSTSKVQSMMGKYYSFKVIRGGISVLDLIPCTDPSGTPGFYDMVGKKFIGNTGAGAPTAGPAV